MQLLRAEDYAERSLDECRFRRLLGPLSEPAGCLVRELIDLMGTHRRVTRPVLPLLLVPQLTELDLSKRSKLVTRTITQMITSRCQNSPGLESLELFYLPFCLDGVFEKVLEPRGTAMVRLRHLSLLQREVSRSTVHLLLAAASSRQPAGLHPFGQTPRDLPEGL